MSKPGTKEREKLILSDFEKTNMLSELKIKQLTEKDFPQAIKILDNELGKNRVRDSNFLYKKYKLFPQFFLGVFLDKEIIGVVCGFPREDYLLLSEIAIDLKFQRRGFGKMLVRAFEKIAKEEYKQINVGALDDSLPFYEALNYKLFLLIQFQEKDYSENDFEKLKIIKYNPGIVEIAIKKCNKKELEKLEQQYPKAHFQYIFYKKI